MQWSQSPYDELPFFSYSTYSEDEADDDDNGSYPQEQVTLSEDKERTNSC